MNQLSLIYLLIFENFNFSSIFYLEDKNKFINTFLFFLYLLNKNKGNLRLLKIRSNLNIVNLRESNLKFTHKNSKQLSYLCTILPNLRT